MAITNTASKYYLVYYQGRENRPTTSSTTMYHAIHRRVRARIYDEIIDGPKHAIIICYI
jgi:hypothetical protein